MKILQVIQFFCPQRGGTVNYVYNLTRHLQQRGHQVSIFTTDDKFDPGFAGSVSPARVVPFSGHLGLLRYSPSMRAALAEEISKYDVVHLNNYWSYQNIIAASQALKNNVPYVLSPHGSLPIMMRGYARKYLFEQFFGNRIIKNAARIIAVSDMECDQVKKRNIRPDKISVIPNAVDRSAVRSVRKGSFRKRFDIRDDEKIILFLGRIHRIKGIDLLINAFAELAKKRSDVRLVLVGPDENYLDQINRQIDSLNVMDRIIFTGSLYDDDKYLAFADADIYVLPSRYEIFAISVLEACACGTPVIVTENQGIASYIRGRAGEVIPFSRDDLLRAMEKLLSDEDLRARYGRNGKKMVEDLFTWDKIIDKYERIYKEVMR